MRRHLRRRNGQFRSPTPREAVPLVVAMIRAKSAPHVKGHETRKAKRSEWVKAHISALTPCQHAQTFFWPLLHDGAHVFGCDACMTCGAGQPPFDKSARVPVPGAWRAVAFGAHCDALRAGL